MVDIKKQKYFPWLDEYKDKFPITDGTIFVYKKQFILIMECRMIY